MKQRCLNCDEVLFEKSFVDRMGHTAVRLRAGIVMESEAFVQFLRCPQCHAKNVVTNDRNAFGVNELKVSHVRPE